MERYGQVCWSIPVNNEELIIKKQNITAQL